MTMNSFFQVVQSPIIAKVLVLLFSGSIFIALRKKDAEGQAGAYLAALSILLIRDVVNALLPVQGLMYASDVFYFSFVLVLFLAPYKRTMLLLFPALAGNAAILAVFVARMLTGFAPALPAWLFGAILAADAVLVLLGGTANGSGKDGQARQLASGGWLPAGIVLLGYAVFALVLGYENVVFAGLIVPVSYSWLFFAGLTGLGIHDQVAMSAITYYEESIDSLYNLSLRVGTVFKGSFSTEDVLRSMNDVIMGETGATGGSMYLVDEFDDIIVAKAYAGVFPPPFPLPENLPRKANRVESYMKHAQFRLGETVLGEVAKTGKNIFIPDVAADERFPSNGDEEFLRLSSFMAVPLMVEDKIIGVAAMAKGRPGEHFSEADFDRCKLLGNFGTLFVSNFFSFLAANEKSGIEKSAGIAAEIQRTIIPKTLPQFPTLGVGAFTAPARGVSGDYYDVIQSRDDRLVGIIGDVAGKGVSAALVMVMIRSILHLVTNTDKDIATVLDWVNRGITGKVDLDHYATLGLVAINIPTGELEYSSASHQPLLIYRRAPGTIETVDIKSVPIGVERKNVYQRKTLRLNDGDIAVLYTDGIVEAMNPHGKQFGRKSLGQVIMKHRDLAPREIASRIQTELVSFVGSARQHDDQTVLIFKMNL
jgi:sigma-B regulation protein RsbU (phosphoserine phosphatase)